MSQYSNYQTSQYRKIFNKYASHESGMLALRDLYLLMAQFGTEITIGHLKTLVYQYDSHRVGMLSFEDFLLFLGDYEACLKDDRDRIDRAFDHFQKKTNSVGVTRNDLRYILQLGENGLTKDQIDEALQDYLGDSRPETPMKMGEFLTKSTGTGLAWCEHQAHAGAKDTIVRDINIRSLATSNLQYFAKTKLRKGSIIEYFTLDPYIVVECAGVTQETTILIGETNPSWLQELSLQVKLPATTDFFELQRWIEGQRVMFHLYDYVVSGSRPHKEWIATGSLPLATVLASSGSLLIASLALKAPTIIPAGFEIKLEVSAIVTTDRLTPYFELPEEIWVSKYHPKMRQDLQFGLRPNDDVERFRENAVLAGTASHIFWDYYSEFYQLLKAKFRRRNFQLVGLNEYNQFWCLACFVRPLYATSSISTPELLAQNVARIGTHQLIPSVGYHPHSSQVASPALVLFRKHASPIEHAILLCDLFLGIGLNAYVCVGTSQLERSAWVVTFDNILGPSLAASTPSTLDHFEQGPFTDGNLTSNPLLSSLSRSRSAKKANRIIFHKTNGKGEETDDGNELARSASGNVTGPTQLRRMSEIIISPPASDDESDGEGYDEAIAFATQNLTRKIDNNAVNLAVGQDVFSLIENLSKKRYTGKKKVKATIADTASPIKKKQDTRAKSVTMLKKVLTDGKEKMLQVLRSKPQYGNKGLTTSALKFEEAKFPAPPVPSKKVSIWDPTTGKCYNIANQEELPPINVGCLFNNRNVWVNIQKYDLVSRLNWEMDKIADWFPFLDEDIKESCGPIQCWYSEPTQLSEIMQEDPEATPNLVKEVCASIQVYRNKGLGFHESPFFSPICKILQQATQRCEAQLHDSTATQVKQSVTSQVESEILAVLPDHHCWLGKVYHFHHANVDEIMQQIIWTGILDCTVPKVLYAVGAQIFDYPWGLKSVWVYVGYCTDLFHATQEHV